MRIRIRTRQNFTKKKKYSQTNEKQRPAWRRPWRGGASSIALDTGRLCVYLESRRSPLPGLAILPRLNDVEGIAGRLYHI
jgi:hypothetical protein